MLKVIICIVLSLSALFDYNGILGQGQSLSVGVMAAGNYTSSQPFKNLKLSLGSKEKSWPISDTDSVLSLVPLTEPLRATVTGITGAYPGNIFGESPHSAMANQLSSLSADLLTVHSSVGESGQAMSKIKKGAQEDGNNSGRAYNASLFEFRAINSLAKKAGKTYGVNGIIFTHGETDNASPTYQREVVELYNNYTADIKSITGQTENPVFIISQQHSFGDGKIPLSTMAAWKVMDDLPAGQIVCSGPKYQYNHSSEGIHLIAQGYDALGEKYAEVYYQVVVKGNKTWRPLEPVSAKKLDSNTVNVTFNIPNPPLQWDTTLPAPAAKSQWRNGRGFELSNGNNAIEISSAEISGSSVLIITSQALPSGTLTVGYAATSQTKRNGGTTRWGLLKDSDNMTGYKTRQPQPNWLVSFEMNVA